MFLIKNSLVADGEFCSINIISRSKAKKKLWVLLDPWKLDTYYMLSITS